MTCMYGNLIYSLLYLSERKSAFTFFGFTIVITYILNSATTAKLHDCQIKWKTISISSGQAGVTCDLENGLICLSSKLRGVIRKCYDYELRLGCLKEECKSTTSSVTSIPTTPSSESTTEVRKYVHYVNNLINWNTKIVLLFFPSVHNNNTRNNNILVKPMPEHASWQFLPWVQRNYSLL